MADVPLYLIRHLEKDLAMMQVTGKSFAVEGMVLDLGYTGPEEVAVLVGRGPIAELLKQIALRIHKEITNGTQDPNLN